MKLVLVHGSGGSHLSFYHQAKYFRGAEAPDLPGHPEGKPCTSIDLYVEWVRGYIRGREYQDVVLGGHSMGGAIAQLYGLKYPEELKGLVLIGTGARLRVHPDYLREHEEAMAAPDLTKWLGQREETLRKVDPQVREMSLQMSERVGPGVYLNDLLCCDKFDIIDRVQEIRLPTLVICGTEDVMTPVKYANYLADKIPGARLTIVEGATHYVHLEKPAEVNPVLEGFLASL